MIGFVRPLARYAAPMSRRQRTGEVDGLSAALGDVVATRREADADHGDGRVDALERVVAGRQRRLVGGARERRARARELRLPEPRLVRLVADDEVLHLRVGRAASCARKRRTAPGASGDAVSAPAFEG